MALILSSEKSQFVQKAIDIYTQNRLGQYSKYLNSTPTFVTYYAINQALSRADLGSGQVYDIIGPNSPIKYLNFLYTICSRFNLTAHTKMVNMK